MANATSTTPGDIQLAGVLAGSTNALSPQLTPTGVVANGYVLPTLSIGADGRVTAAANGTPTSVAALLPVASRTVKGIAQIGENVNVTTSGSSGYQPINFGASIVGSASVGFCLSSPDYSFLLTVDGGTPQQIEIQSGSYTYTSLVAALNAKISGAVLSITGGNLKMTSSTQGPTSTIAITNDLLFQFMDGFVSIGTAVIGAAIAVISVDIATDTNLGVVKNGYGIGNNNGVLSLSLPMATSGTAGIVKVQSGNGLNYASNTISYTPPTIPVATTSVQGIAKFDSTYFTVTAGEVTSTIGDATASVKGIVSVTEGNGLTVTNGNLAMSPIVYPTATATVIGGVIVPTAGNLVVDGSGNISVPIATGSVFGVSKIATGNGLVNTSGTITFNAASLPTATSSVAGTVKSGTNTTLVAGALSTNKATTTTDGTVIVPASGNLVVDGSGNISVPIATGSVFGVSKIATGNGLVNTSGTITFNAANITVGSNSLVGPLKGGTNTSIDESGAINVATATTSILGVASVTAANGLSISSGAISMGIANGATAGAVKQGATGTVIVTTGSLDVDTSKVSTLNTYNTFTKAQNTTASALTYAATVTPDFSLSNTFTITLTGNVTIGTPTNAVVGGEWCIVFAQDATGSRIVTWPASTVFKFRAGQNTALTTTALKQDIVWIKCVAAGVFLCDIMKGF